jgi:hypothetical protein
MENIGTFLVSRKQLIATSRSIGRMDTVWQVCDPDYLGMCKYEIDGNIWFQVLKGKSRKMKLRFSQRFVRSLPSLKHWNLPKPYKTR